MSDRRYVILLLFDVPTDEKSSRRAYGKFIRNIRNFGFMRLQKSVYVLLLHNAEGVDGIFRKVAAFSPDGNVSMLPMSLTEFERLQTIRGDPFDFGIFSNSQIEI